MATKNSYIYSKALFFLVLIVISVHSFGQNEVQSKPILEKTATTNNGYKYVIAEFSFTSSNTKTGESSTEKGKIAMKGEKYHLTLSNSEIIFDGKDVYNYLPKSNEVTITVPEPAKNENGLFLINNPKDIFKFYTKNFKSKFIKETQVKGKTTFEIDLYPIDLKTKYSRVRMHIDKLNYQIIDIKIFHKDGAQQFLEFSDYKVNSAVPESEFQFDQKKYPGIVVNDMRF